LIIAENSKVIQDQGNEQLISVSYGDTISLTGSKTVRIKNSGQKFLRINSFFFDFLKGYNIPVGFQGLAEEKALLYPNHYRFPFCIKILNTVDKRMSKIFGKNEFEQLSIPVYELHYGTEKENMITESHLVSLEICPVEDLKVMFRIASKINVVLKSFFERRNSVLSEVKCFFGKQDERIFIIDDFTPQSIKVFAQDEEQKSINPYKLTNSETIKNYIDYLLNFTTN